jgi:hypothetical protein
VSNWPKYIGINRAAFTRAGTTNPRQRILQGQAASHNEAASCRVLMNFLCFDLFAGRADEDELFQTRSKFWDRPEVLHGVAARGAY